MLVVVVMMLVPVLMLMIVLVLMLMLMIVLMFMLMLVLVLMIVLLLVLFTRAAATMSMQFFCHVSSLYFFPFYRFFLYRLQSYDMFAATGLHFKGKKVKKRLAPWEGKNEK